jgi:uncharacterized protein DUF4114
MKVNFILRAIGKPFVLIFVFLARLIDSRVLIFCTLLPDFRGIPTFADPASPPLTPVCGDKDGSESPYVAKCPNFVQLTDRHIFQVPGAGPVNLRFGFVFRGTAVFNNELAVFRVDDVCDSVDGQKLGDAGYLQAAARHAKVVFPSGSTASTPDVALSFNGGDLLLFFIVRNQTLQDLLANNPNNDPDKLPLAFLSLDFLNPDGFDHFVAFENKGENLTQLAFEDLTGRGDRNYQDVVCNVTNQFQATVPVGSNPGQSALDPELPLTAVTNFSSNSLSFINTSNSTASSALLQKWSRRRVAGILEV